MRPPEEDAVEQVGLDLGEVVREEESPLREDVRAELVSLLARVLVAVATAAEGHADE